MHMRKLTNLVPQPVRFNLRRLIFYGNRARCILCGNSVRGFRAHGGGAEVLQTRRVVGGMRREDDRCPVCHGRDRSRLMMLYLQSETGLGKKPLRMLDVAPDYGLYLWLQHQAQLDYTATDIDVSRYAHINGMRGADITALPFEDGTFDVILCSHVLEHVPDDAAAMAELYRVLRPGGHALLIAPFALDGHGSDEAPDIEDPSEQDRRFGQWDHVRLYDRDDFVERMRAAGFQAELLDPFLSYPEQAKRLALNPLELLPVGRKAGS